MHALAPLLFILLVFRHKQLKADKLYRATVFSLIGINYFVFSQYILYWYRIFPSENASQYFPGVLVALILVGIALSPWTRRSTIFKTSLFVCLFVVSLVVTLTANHFVKESIAEIGGYFDKENSNLLATRHSRPLETPIQLAEMGLSLSVPRDWQAVRLDSGHTELIREISGKTVIKLRPNCLGHIQMDTPTFVQNTLALFESNAANTIHSHRCVILAGEKSCFIQVNYLNNADIQEKWRWITIASNQALSFQADVVIYVADEQTKLDVQNILASITRLPNGPSAPCTTPALWL